MRVAGLALGMVAVGCATYAPPAPEPARPVTQPARLAIVVLHGAGLSAAEADALSAEVARSGRIEPEMIVDVDERLRAVASEVDAEHSLEARAALSAELLREAERALNKLDVAAARRALDDAAALLGTAPADPRSFQVWIGIETARAVADLVEGKPAEATARLRDVARLRPSHELDVRRVPPEALDAFVGAKQEASKTARARLRIESAPDAATVFVNGEERGRSPADIDVAAGRQFVTAVRPGHRATAAVVDATPGPAVVVPLSLRAASRAEAAVDARAELARGAAPGATAPPSVEALHALAAALGLERAVIMTSRRHASLLDRAAFRLRALPGATPSAIAASWAPPPAPATWTGVPDDDGPDRGWYRKWWWWVVIGAGGLLLAPTPLRRTLPP